MSKITERNITEPTLSFQCCNPEEKDKHKLQLWVAVPGTEEQEQNEDKG